MSSRRFAVILAGPIALGGAGCVTLQPRPLDIVGGSGVDANGLLINPHWGGQTGNAPVEPTVCSPSGSAQDDPANWTTGANACTRYPVKTERGKGCGPHVNWFPIQYSGTIAWENHSAPGTDDDYNILMSRPDKAMYGTQRPDSLLCEFDSDETVDHFHTAWWQSFHNTVDGGNAGARDMLANKEAIVIGLASFDCAGHEPGQNHCDAELHPVYALAIHVTNDPQHDHWAFFLRNRADEGYCASNEQLWTPARFTNKQAEYHLLLPHTGAKGFAFNSQDVRLFGKGNSGPDKVFFEGINVEAE